MGQDDLRDARPITILLADDDREDRELARDALQESRLLNDLRFVEDGEELLTYLRRQGKYSDPSTSPRPGIILLDLKMPRMDGREALEQIKLDPELRRIPVVVMTTSRAESDILQSYDLGAASYITKPVSFTALVEVMGTLGRYWVQVVELPSN